MQAEALVSDKALNDSADEPADDYWIMCSIALLMNPPRCVVPFFWAKLRNQKLFGQTEYSSHH